MQLEFDIYDDRSDRRNRERRSIGRSSRYDTAMNQNEQSTQAQSTQVLSNPIHDTLTSSLWEQGVY